MTVRLLFHRLASQLTATPGQSHEGCFQGLNGGKGLKNAPKWDKSLVFDPEIALKWEKNVKMRLPYCDTEASSKHDA
jgi:hypothetical protein